MRIRLGSFATELCIEMSTLINAGSLNFIAICLQAFDGGYLHHGMFGPAQWAVKHIGPVLNEQLRSNNGYA